MDRLLAILATPLDTRYEEPSPLDAAATQCNRRVPWLEYERRQELLRDRTAAVLTLLEINHRASMDQVLSAAPKKWTQSPHGWPRRFMAYCWARLPDTAMMYLIELRAINVERAWLDAHAAYSIEYCDVDTSD